MDYGYWGFKPLRRCKIRRRPTSTNLLTSRRRASKLLMAFKNTYYLLRHGEAISNVKQIVSSWPEKFENSLTDKGRKQIKKSAKNLKNKHIGLIFASDLLRTRQTSEIVGKTLKIKPKFDKRLREVGFGNLNGRQAEELLYLSFEKERLKNSFQKGETYENVLKRVSEFLKDTEKKHKGKNILIVSHQCPLWILENHINGFSLNEGLKRIPEKTESARAK